MCKFDCWVLGRSWLEAIWEVSHPRGPTADPWRGREASGIHQQRKKYSMSEEVQQSQWLDLWEIDKCVPLPWVRTCPAVTQRPLLPHNHGTCPFPLPWSIPTESHSLGRGQGGGGESTYPHYHSRLLNLKWLKMGKADVLLFCEVSGFDYYSKWTF